MKITIAHIIVPVLFSCILYLIFFTNPNKALEKKKEVIQNSLSLQDSIYNYIYSIRIDHPSIVFSQAMLESNKCSSKIFKENNNLFGMRISGSRPSTAIGVKYGYAIYNSWKESIIDYALYQSAFIRNFSEEEYYIRLKENYANDPEYIQKLKKSK